MIVQPQPHRPTPEMSHHARERCREMGISTKVAKRIVQHANLVTEAHRRHLRPEMLGSVHLARSPQYPQFVVTFVDRGDDLPLLITSVLVHGKVYYRSVDGSVVYYRPPSKDGDRCPHQRWMDQACHSCEDDYVLAHPDAPLPQRWAREGRTRPVEPIAQAGKG